MLHLSEISDAAEREIDTESLLPPEQLQRAYHILSRMMDELFTVMHAEETTPRSLLAEADYAAISQARQVCHRLSLWRRYPEQYPGVYVCSVPEDQS